MSVVFVRGSILIVAAFALFATSRVAAQEPALHWRLRQALTLLEMWLDGQRSYEAIPSVSAAIVHDQKTVWTGAIGLSDRERTVEATPATVYSVCSNAIGPGLP